MQTNSVLKWFVYVGLFALLFTPLLVFNSYFFPYITSKVFVFRIIVELVFFAWVVLAIREPKYRPKLSGILLALSLFILIFLLAGIFGDDPFRSFWSNYERMGGTVNYLHMLALFVVLASFFKSRKVWHVFFGISLLASFIVGAQALGQLGHVDRIDGALGNPIYLAIYALFQIGFAAILFVSNKKEGYSPYLYWLYVAAGIFNFIILFLSGTRGTLLGLYSGIFVSALLLSIYERRYVWLRNTGIGVCILFVLLPIGFFSIRNTNFIQSHDTLRRFSDISLQGGGEARMMLWGMSLESIPEHPFLGWGPENFPLIFAKYYDPQMYNQEMWFDRAHDIIFDRLTATGILGLISYLLVFVAFLFSLWNVRRLRVLLRKITPRTFKQGKLSKARHFLAGRNYEEFSLHEKVVLTGLIVAYFVHLVFVFDDLASLFLFMVVLAYVASRVSRERKPLFGDKAAGFVPATLIGIVVALVVLAGLYFANYKPMKQNVTLSESLQTADAGTKLALFKKALAYNTFGNQETREQLVEAADNLNGKNTDPKALTEFFNYAESEIKLDIAARPQAPRGYFFEANLYAHYGQFDKALTAINSAIALSPKKQQFLNIKTVFLIQMNENEKAMRVAQLTYELEKNDTDSAKYYAAALIANGEEEKAQAVLRDAFGTDIVFDPNIISAYAERKDYPEIIALWQAKVKQDPSDLQAMLSLSYAYFKNGEIEQSVNTLKKIEDLQPKLKEQIEKYISAIRNGKDPATIE